MKQPIVAMAKGWCNCAPVTMPNTKCSKAMIAPKAVINNLSAH